MGAWSGLVGIGEIVEEKKGYSKQKDESRHGDSDVVQSSLSNSEIYEFIREDEKQATKMWGRIKPELT